jgi:hypothetical protein
MPWSLKRTSYVLLLTNNLCPVLDTEFIMSCKKLLLQKTSFVLLLTKAPFANPSGIIYWGLSFVLKAGFPIPSTGSPVHNVKYLAQAALC